MDFLGERGFDSLRFGRGLAVVETGALPLVLPLLIHIPNKSHLRVRELSRVQTATIVNACAGCRVETLARSDLKNGICIHLRERRVEISEDGSSGLRDVILAATLIRVYNREGQNPTTASLSALLNEARLTLTDELPQALTYSGTTELHCERIDATTVVFYTADEAPVTQSPGSVEHIDFHIKVA